MIKRIKVHLLTIVALHLLLFACYGYHKIWDKRPFSIHQWRQCDCLSIAKNYCEEGMDFFHPEIHWQGSQGGKAVSEFPLVNYSVAALWKMFGEQEFIYRVFVLSLYLVSLLFLFAMCYLLSGSIGFSYFSTLIISTSPLLAYYSFSFISDVPALSLSIIALSLLFFYLNNGRSRFLYLSISVSALAVLLKASALPVFVIILVCAGWHRYHLARQQTSFNIRSLISANIPLMLAFCISGLCILAWYAYAISYNRSSNGVFLIETLPIWRMEEKVVDTARSLYYIQLNMYFSKGVLIGFLMAGLWMLLNFRSLNWYLNISLVISIACTTGFILLFFQVFDVHDYYLINTMICPVVLLGCLGYYLKNRLKTGANRKWAIMAIFITTLNVLYCASHVRLRNIEDDWFTRITPFISNDEKKLSDWLFFHYRETDQAFETVTPYLRKLGIQRTDKVVSISDPSFNITLYLMDQKGFTLTKDDLLNHPEKLQDDLNAGAKYIMVNDTSLAGTFLQSRGDLTRLGSYKNVTVIKINKP